MWDFDDSVYSRPFRAAALTSLLRGASVARPSPSSGDTPLFSGNASSRPLVACETGFGAGHSALLFIHLLPPGSSVHSFDIGRAKHVVAANDAIDAMHPGALLLYIGDSRDTLPQLRRHFPGVECDVIYLDGATDAESIAADARAMARYAAPHHVVALAGAGRGTAAYAAWEALSADGEVSWEGTIYESPTAREESDAVVYGSFRLPDDVEGGGVSGVEEGDRGAAAAAATAAPVQG